MIDRRIMSQWATATRRQQWDEANRLWPMLMEQWLKPPVIDQNYWNTLLRRKMAVLERREQRKGVNDDEFDNWHGGMNQ